MEMVLLRQRMNVLGYAAQSAKESSTQISVQPNVDRGRDGSSPPLPPNRTGGFPASGSPVGGFTSTLRTEAKLDEPPQG